MSTGKSIVALAAVAFGFTLTGWLSAQSFAASRDDVVVDPQIAGPVTVTTGIWRTKTLPVFDPVARTLLRRMYTVWDPVPDRDLDFVWIPKSLRDDTEGKINGVGRLIWRVKGKPAYDRSSIFSEYRGVMKDGRAEGQGSYFDATGVVYKGGWKNGMMDGFGTLTMQDTDEYIGEMRAGKANGAGRYIDVTGEIFEGHFIDGARDGLGTTTLPNGNGYRSKWVQGKETEDSRLLRLAQSGGRQSPGISDDVRIGVTVDRTAARDGDLVYAASSAGSNLTIEPDNKRLMSMWKGGGEIQLSDNEDGNGDEYGVFSLSRGELLPLTLVFEVQNRAAAPIAVSGAYLSVASSASDLQPAIQLHRNYEDSNQCTAAEFRPKFRAENFGWGAAEGATLHFAFTNPNASGKPKTLDHSKSLGNLTKTANVDLEAELRAAGVNASTLKAKSEAGFVCSSKSPAACLQQLRSTGLFGTLASQVGLQDTSILLNATGTLDYTWRDSKGAQKTASSPYSVQVPLGHIKIEAECGEGGETDVIAAKPLQFKLDQAGYRLPISFQRSIPAGRTSRFTTTVNAAKSSEHDFTVVLQLADGREISSRPINLTYYVPSWFPSN
jgi:hypothetical protein